MTTERGHALRWVCPECQARIRSEALTLDAAEGAMVQLVREHVAIHGEPVPNPVAQVRGGWLSAAGHLVELWGGPHDGSQVWCPPGELPLVVGIIRTTDGAVVPVRAATARLLPNVSSYWLSETATETPARRARYVYSEQARRAA